jgi:phosphatidylglycerol---prolipoprotein diacylglyceryl transferase
MQQILFRIPIRIPGWLPDGIPAYGYGTMLAIAVLVCIQLAGRRAEKEGIPRTCIYDLSLWLIICGISGARLTYMYMYGVPLTQFLRLWDGGLVFYGSFVGGIIGFLAARYFVIRKYQVSGWKVVDIVAPFVALGLALGRIGCLLNGCCYGNVAPTESLQLHFPLSAPPRHDLVGKGYQTAAGFTLAETAPDFRTVGAVEPGSPAAIAGLQSGDVIEAVDGAEVRGPADIDLALGRDWPRGKNDLTLTVTRNGETMAVGPFVPRTIGLHPTQVYSSIGAFLIFCLLSAFTPMKWRDGQVFDLLLLSYPLHRFLVEALRNDTQVFILNGWWPPMTLSQNISVGIFAAGIVLGFFVWRPAAVKPAFA